MRKRSFVVILTLSFMLLLNGMTCLAAHGENTLRPGEFLSMWQWIESSNHEYLLQMQTGGKMVLYSKSRGVLWTSPISYYPGYNHRPNRFIMQHDGNLVMYHNLFPSKPDPGDIGDQTLYDMPVWDSKTYNNPGAHLILQDDGNLVIYQGTQPLWATGTNL
ncbi:lectin [Vallitalea guaymasensis]|uniref:lectin n=1 Tax=Vallitalea guaymasensis TaxID=1185412 RepID=UPI000DE35FBC|nr:lectin [Vallitalea guaymasensis]